MTRLSPLSVTNEHTPTDALTPSHLVAVLDSLQEGLVLLGGDGRILFVNESAATMLGYSGHELVGRRMHEALHQPRTDRSPHPARSCPITRTLRDNRHFHRDNDAFWRKDGARLPVSYSAHPLHKGGIAGTAVVFTSRSDPARRKGDEEDGLRLLAENASDFIFRYRLLPTPGFEYVSRSAKALTGFSPEEFYADPGIWTSMIHTEEAEAFASIASSPDALRRPFTLRWVRRDGSVVWGEASTTPSLDEEGRLVAVDGIVRDISERKRVEEELRLRTRQQAVVVKLGAAALAETDLPLLTERAARLIVEALHVPLVGIFELRTTDDLLVLRAGDGWRPGEVGRIALEMPQRSDVEATTISDPSPAGTEARREAAALPPEITERGITHGITARIAGRQEVIGLIGAYAAEERSFSQEDVRFLQAVANVLAEAKNRSSVERDLRVSLARVSEMSEHRRRLLSNLLQAEERERERIAGDIHDDPLQVMTAVGMRLGIMRSKTTDEDSVAQLDQLDETIRLAIERLRSLLFELRPTTLDREGLAGTLAASMDELTQAGVETALDDRLVREPQFELRGVLYRIAKEALNNIRKHARPRRVDVTIESLDDGVRMCIRDDGEGFSPEELEAEPGHLGLTAMAERAELAGGWLRLDSAPGKGTTVECWVPEGRSG